MSNHAFDLPSSFGGEVRLFPLPNVVMFPRNILPLHIFESRYREMFEDAINDDNLITMSTLQPGFENQYYGRPAISPFVCIGQVTTHKRNDNGTYNLVLSGLQRARVEYEIEPVKSFRKAKVDVLADDESDVDTPRASSLVSELVGRLRQTTSGFEKLIDEYQNDAISLAALTDVVAFHLHVDLETKLRLLAETNVIQRVQKLCLSLPQPEEIERSEFPPGFSRN